MNFLKKNWIFVALGLVSLLLGVLAILTAVKLKQEKPVAPTAPEKSKALEGNPVPACQLTFSLSQASPSPSPSSSPGTSPSPSPSVSPSPSPSATPSPTPSPSVSPSATPASCNNTCSTDANCSAGLTCVGNVCRNPSCNTQTNCSCVNPSPSSSPVAASCNNSCSVNSDCTSGLICSGNVCRNSSCTTKTNCTCDLAKATPKASVIPTVPVSGTSWPTIFLVIGGAALLVIGFALP